MSNLQITKYIIKVGIPMSSSIQLFRIGDQVEALTGLTVPLEAKLQRIIEDNMESFFDISFLASEYSTGRVHGGRIDSLGIDSTNCPVIVEYKRSLSENVMNQGLYYLDWLLDHKAEFELLVLNKFGREQANQIDWNGARLLCIAGNFTKYDEYAVKQINRNIELYRYVKYGEDLLLFELVNAVISEKNNTIAGYETDKQSNATTNSGKTVQQFIDGSPETLKDLYKILKDYCTQLGDDVTEKIGKQQVVFKRFKNFACIEVHPRDHELVVYVKVDPDSVSIENGFTRDMRGIGHWGTGDLEIRIRERAQLEKANELIQRSYDIS